MFFEIRIITLFLFIVTCPLTEGMEDETIVTDKDITLKPNIGIPDDIRPNGLGWNTTTPEDRVITIKVGDKINIGGIIELVEKENIKEYVVELINPPKVNIILNILYIFVC